MPIEPQHALSITKPRVMRPEGGPTIIRYPGENMAQLAARENAAMRKTLGMRPKGIVKLTKIPKECIAMRRAERNAHQRREKEDQVLSHLTFPMTRWNLATRSGIPQATVYDAFVRLLGRGLVAEIKSPGCATVWERISANAPHEAQGVP